MFKIDKTLIDNMNMNKSCIIITHKETVRKRVAPQQLMTLDDEGKLPPEVREQAKEFVHKANAKAQQIIENAYAQAEEIKEAARQEGLGQGLCEAAEKHEAQMGMHYSQAESALNKLEAYRQSLFDALETHVLELSLDVAEKIINLQLQNDDTVYKELVKKAVDSLKIADNFTLTVSRDEYERFFKDSAEWLRAETGCGTFEVAVDHKGPKGVCVVESDNQLVDAGVGTQLNKIRQYLGEQVD